MKSILVLWLSLLTFILSAQVPTNGLVSSYPFTGNSNDASGNGNNLTPYNGPTPTADRFGNPNCAYFFDGIDDYFLAPNPGPLFKKSRSVAFWAKTTASFNNSGYSVLSYGDPNGSGSRFELGLNSGCNGFYLDIGNGYATASYSNTTDNLWHFYVVTYDSTSSTQLSSVKYYVDAVLTNSFCIQPWVQTINTINSLPINIGRLSASYPRYFSGCLDDIHVYNRPLSQNEVSNMFSPCSGPPVAPAAITGTVNVCNGIPALYSVNSVSSATSYSWITPAGWTGSSNASAATFTPGANSGVLSVAAVNGCGTSSFVSINVTLNNTPTVTATVNNSVVCKGNSSTLQAFGATSYSWSNGMNTASISVTPSITTQFTVTGYNSAGCFNKVVKTVSVTNYPLPTIAVSGQGTSCAGQQINLASNGASTYTWLPGNLNGFFVSVSPTVTTTFTVTGTDNNGCYNSALYTQTVNTCTGFKTELIGSASFEISPNPSNGSLMIATNSTGFIEIYTLQGSVVFNSKIYEKENFIELHSLQSGIYFVRLTTSKEVLIKKLIKE